MFSTKIFPPILTWHIHKFYPTNLMNLASLFLFWRLFLNRFDRKPSFLRLIVTLLNNILLHLRTRFLSFYFCWFVLITDLCTIILRNDLILLCLRPSTIFLIFLRSRFRIICNFGDWIEWVTSVYLWSKCKSDNSHSWFRNEKKMMHIYMVHTHFSNYKFPNFLKQIYRLFFRSERSGLHLPYSHFLPPLLWYFKHCEAFYISQL